MPQALLPGYLLAGQSAAARKICALTGAIGMQNLKPELEQAVNGQSGIHFGIITREQEAQAWQAARHRFPEDPSGRELLEFSVKNTDASWWKYMKKVSDEAPQTPSNYWLHPFQNYKADCAYIVGDYEYVASLLVRLIDRGIKAFILEIPPCEAPPRTVHCRSPNPHCSPTTIAGSGTERWFCSWPGRRRGRP